jgi:hypothetical protein
MAVTERKEYIIGSMRSAVQAVKDKEMGFLRAAKTFNVPRSTSLACVKSVDSRATVLPYW